MNRIFTSLIILSLTAVLLTGCGGEKRPPGMPKLYSASIVVTQEGAPLAGATVQLIAEDAANKEWGPLGTTNASGVAVLRTNGKYSGAPLGSYKVTISKTDFEEHPHPEWASLPMEDPNFQRYKQIAENLKPIHFVESKYVSIADTPLRVEITAKEKSYTVDAGPKPTK